MLPRLPISARRASGYGITRRESVYQSVGVGRMHGRIRVAVKNDERALRRLRVVNVRSA